jgi:hypothetical protein
MSSISAIESTVDSKFLASVQRHKAPERLGESHGSATGLLDDLEEFTRLCVKEHVGRKPQHFGDNLNIKQDGQFYIKDVPILPNEDYKDQTSRKKALAACISKAIYETNAEFSPDKYSKGSITKKVWKKFTTYRDEWLVIHRAGGSAAHERKLGQDKIDAERGRQKRISKEQEQRDKMGDEAFNRRMKTEGAIKLSSEKRVTEAELRQFNAWFLATGKTYTFGMTEGTVPHFSSTLLPGANTHKINLYSNNKADVLAALRTVQVDCEFGCRLTLVWEDFSDNFPSTHCLDDDRMLPILRHDRLSSGVTLHIVGIVEHGIYAASTVCTNLYRIFPKEWARFEYLNPKKLAKLRVCYKVDKCLSKVVLYNEAVEITIHISPLAPKHDFSLTALQEAMYSPRTLHVDPEIVKVQSAIDARLGRMAIEKKNSSKGVPTKDEMRRTINKLYGDGMMTLVNYTKGLEELEKGGWM